MQERAALSCLLPSLHHIMFVSAQGWKEMIALDLWDNSAVIPAGDRRVN